MKTATVEEVKKMKKAAEEKIGKILIELAETGVYIGTIRTNVFSVYIDEKGNRSSVKETLIPAKEYKEEYMAIVEMAIHLQEKPN